MKAALIFKSLSLGYRQNKNFRADLHQMTVSNRVEIPPARPLNIYYYWLLGQGRAAGANQAILWWLSYYQLCKVKFQLMYL